MKIEQKGWEPILESQSSERFVCNYGGQFAQHLELNRPAIERFLTLASLEDPVLFTESRHKRPRAVPDVNPDGSITSKGVLRWGEKPTLEERKFNEYFQVVHDKDNWVIAVNGDLILKDLTKDGTKPVRETEKQFGNQFNHLLRVGLKEALLKDKCTLDEDPGLIMRIIGSCVILSNYYLAIAQPSLFGSFSAVGQLGAVCIDNFLLKDGLDQAFKKAKKFNLRLSEAFKPTNFYHRRSVNNIIEGISIPFEIDRLALAYGYLDYQMLRGNPLVRVTSN